MKGSLFLQLAALSTAFVVPNDQLNNLQHVAVESRPSGGSVFDKLPSKAEILKELDNTFDHVSEEISDAFDRVSGKYQQVEKSGKHKLDEALAAVKDFGVSAGASIEEGYYDAQAWFDSAVSHEVDLEEIDWFGLRDDHGEHPPHHGPPGHPHPPPKDGDHDHPPHDGPPHHPPHHGDDHDHPPHDGPPHHVPGGPFHPPHHDKSNLTVYQLISSSNYTTKLAKWIEEFPDIVEALNGTEANFTIFAPSDKAFEKIPDDAPKPPKEVLKKILSYHISPKFCMYSAPLTCHTPRLTSMIQTLLGVSLSPALSQHFLSLSSSVTDLFLSA